jgi:RNA polymerase sigma-B factor
MPDAADERAALFAEYHRTGDHRIRDQLIESNRGLAESIARRYTRQRDSDDDLRQVALLGLLKAVERFDPGRGLAFSSFATPTIEGELKRHFRDQRWSVRMPRQVQEQALEVSRAVGTLTQSLGRSPTIDDLVVETGLTSEDVIEALEAGRASTTAPIEADGTDRGVLDQFGARDPGLEEVERRMIVSQLLDELSPRERTVVVQRFYEGRTQSSIAEELGVSQVHVSRILAQALQRLRRATDLGGDST